MRFLPVNVFAMATPQSNPNRSMPSDRLRQRAELKDDKSQQVRAGRTPAFRPWPSQAGTIEKPPVCLACQSNASRGY
jgi:hypothetical protein